MVEAKIARYVGKLYARVLRYLLRSLNKKRAKHVRTYNANMRIVDEYKAKIKEESIVINSMYEKYEAAKAALYNQYVLDKEAAQANFTKLNEQTNAMHDAAIDTYSTSMKDILAVENEIENALDDLKS